MHFHLRDNFFIKEMLDSNKRSCLAELVSLQEARLVHGPVVHRPLLVVHGPVGLLGDCPELQTNFSLRVSRQEYKFELSIASVSFVSILHVKLLHYKVLF